MITIAWILLIIACIIILIGFFESSIKSKINHFITVRELRELIKESDFIKYYPQDYITDKLAKKITDYFLRR